MDPEYDYEGKMAKSQLRTIARDAMDLEDILEDETNLPEWVQSKITLAEHNISAAYDYMVDELENEDDEDEDMDEETKPTEKQVKMAKGVAFDPRYRGGNLTGATRTIEKIKKGLSKHPSVSKALRSANEQVEITEYSVRNMPTKTLQKHWSKHKDQPNPSPAFGYQLKHVAKELKRRKALQKEELLPKQKEVQKKILNKELEDNRKERASKKQAGAVGAIHRSMERTMKREEAGQVDELKDTTYRNYIKKASLNRGLHMFKAGMDYNNPKGDASLAKAKKRQIGVEKAAEKLTKVKMGEAQTTLTVGNRMHNKALSDYLKKKLEKIKNKPANPGLEKLHKNKMKVNEVAGQRGRPKRGEGEESDRHIIMQLRSAQDLEGNKEITFRGGKKAKVAPEHINKILKLHDHPNTKPVHKRMLRVAIAKSPEHLARVAKEIK